MFGRGLLAAVLALPLLGTAPATITTVALPTHPWAKACDRWDEWDKPGPPFKVYGNTYYVGTCGIAAILITSDEGHILIDSGTEAGAEIVLANIRALGFDPADIGLLLNSHEHFDHVGGLAKIQQETGAEIVTSAIGRAVLLTGEADAADPQFGMHEPMKPVSSARVYDDRDARALLEDFGIRPLPTPGHSPGAMSWAWQSCEGEECLSIVYADSLSAVSRDDYRFLDHREYVGAFHASLNRIAEQSCDIVLTPHPSASDLHNTLVTLALRKIHPNPPIACIGYAQQQRNALSERLGREAQQ